jgi:hypothetical protein
MMTMALMITGLAGCPVSPTPVVPSPLFEVFELPKAQNAEHIVRMLAGPNPSGGPATVSYNLVNGEPVVDLQDGWVLVEVQYAPGVTMGSNWGKARTKRVSGTAHGTRFLVQQEGLEPQDVHRVIQLSESPDRVTVALTSTMTAAQDLTSANTYFEVVYDGPLPAQPSPVVPGSPVEALVKHVLAEAAKAGFP